MNDKAPPRRPRSRLPTFTVATLLLAMFMFSALGAGLYYGSQAVAAGFSFEGVLIVIALCAPAVLLLAIKLGRLLLRWIDPPRSDEG